MRPGRARTVTAARGDPSRKPKQGECKTFVKTGNCPRGEDCPWVHPQDITARGRSPTRKRGVAPKAKAAPRSNSPKSDKREKSERSQRRSPSRGSEKSDRPKPCSYYLKGKCTKGKDCTFWHVPMLSLIHI